MITNILNTSDIYEIEPSLVDFMRQDLADFSDAISHSFRIMLMDLRNRGYDLRLLNTPLSLHDSGAENSSVTGEQSGEDYINRNLLTIETSAISSSAEVFKLQGTNESDPSSTDWDDVATVTVMEVGSVNTQLTTFYKYYRLNKTTSGNITYKAYLSENIYFYMHAYKAMELIYNSIRRLPNTNVFTDKTDEYEAKYNDLLTNGLFSYDSDNDGKVSYTESKTDTRTLWITL